MRRNAESRKKDVMEELIAKSKFYKAEKQKQRDDDEDMLDKLDSDFKAISQGGLLSSALRKAVGHMKPTPRRLHKPRLPSRRMSTTRGPEL